MARAQATDYLHNFRFHVRADTVAGLGQDPLQPGGTPGSGRGEPLGGLLPEAGFQAVTTPEYTVESVEYRDGLHTYAEKYPGIPTTNDLTFTRGVARNDSAFLDWVTAAIEGREYRSDVTVMHAVRVGRGSAAGANGLFNSTLDFTAQNSRIYKLFNAFPMRVKVSGDLDSGTSDVSLAEVDVAFESFSVAAPTAAL
jgi:phage tail-like protein